MKRILIILSVAVLSLCWNMVSAQETTFLPQSQLTAMADSAYNDDNFDMAADTYKTIIDSYGPSAKLYYNLGNCYYRLGKNGNAIIAYERALRIDPTDEDARYNLDFVNSRITDRPGERGTFAGNAVAAIARAMTADAWAWVTFALFTLTAAGVLLYFFTTNVMLRKTGFFGGFAAMILFCISFFIARQATAIATDKNQAVVTAPSTILSTVPREPGSRAQEAMLLHEGTRVEILDSVVSSTPGDSVKKLWYDVEVDNTHRAWIDAAAVERI